MQLTLARMPSGLAAPLAYVNATLEERALICNGCGSAQAKFDFIPDTIYGLDISWACWIHDWMYYEGRTIEDKDFADDTLLRNLNHLINNDTNWWRKPLKPLMRRRALKYYEAVVLLGLSAFQAGKA